MSSKSTRVFSESSSSYFSRVVDGVQDIYRTRVGSLIVGVVNAFCCFYAFYALNSVGYMFLSLIPCLGFFLNALFVLSILGVGNS